MAYQFVHIETYSTQPRKMKGSKDHWNSAKQVFLEAARDPEYSKHVDAPREPLPVLSHGAISVAELRVLHDRKRDEVRETVQAKSGNTYERRLRSDAATLYTEIHSHPMASRDYLADPKKNAEEIQEWAGLAIRDFRKRMPEGIAFAAVLHLDEQNVHLHILAVNIDDPRLDANKLHVGKVAAAEYRAKHDKPSTLASLPKPEMQQRPRKPKKPRPSKNRVTQRKNVEKHERALAAWEEACDRVNAANASKFATWEKENGQHLHAARKEQVGKNPEKAAYTSAMEAFQDRYYQAVGKPCGLLRKGPAQERLTTKQYAARKAAAKSLAQERTQNLRTETGLEVREQELALRERAVAEAEGRLAAEKDSWKARKQEIGAREQSVAMRERGLSEKERMSGAPFC
ncbi:plasmid recombination protein [Qingshengfaniella alkalisoli]|uniref:Mob protein n=1 Tax=Qingshengfaniella alkalisoli TaxID=2599296 RepID=A0A5B8IYH1_9RHOB|nr:plasmid recombination protein [Qingshengfaniella alkalisoli]QDY71182.1 Mob protein [Qingshengfaniella alkalisoli]